MFCAPAAALLAVALLAAAATPARAKDFPIAAIAAAYSDAIPACNTVLFPQLKAGVLAATKACWGPIDTAIAAPPTECPSDECVAYAAAFGPNCWKGFHLATGAIAKAHLAALEGGAPLPASDVARLQRLADNLTAADYKANPRVDVAAGIEAPDAAAVAALKKDATYAAALGAACFPPAPPPAPADAAAPAPLSPTWFESMYEIYADEMPACAGVLNPASAELAASYSACYFSTPQWKIPTECSDVCRASAALMGADCHKQWYEERGGALGAAAVAVAGGKQLSANDAAKMQRLNDLSTTVNPSLPPLDWLLKLKEKDIALGATTGYLDPWFKAIGTACAPWAGASPAPALEAAAASAPSAVPAAAAASGGARAVAAGAAAAALLALLAA